MQKILIFGILVYLSLNVRALLIDPSVSANDITLNSAPETDDLRSDQQAWLFACFTGRNSNRNGLHFAWSTDGYKWTAIGTEHSFLKSDYGSRSAEKKMRDPFIMQGPDGVYHCIWTINWEANVIGHTSTHDFITFEDVTAQISFPAGARHGSVIPVPRKMIDDLIVEKESAAARERENSGKEGVLAPRPLFRDPVYDGAADPVVIWNPQVNGWWMFYTNRRANMTHLPGVSRVFGTPVGAVKSVLSGLPGDRNLTPVTSGCLVDQEFPLELPAWFLTVICI